MNLLELTNNINQWAKDRGITINGTANTQALKLMSEMGELADNLAKGKDVKDDIGDCYVVLCNIAALKGLTMEECVSQAWNDIKDRKGFLNANGTFIKSTDAGYDKLYAEFLASQKGTQADKLAEQMEIEAAKQELKEIDWEEFKRRWEGKGFTVKRTPMGVFVWRVK